MFRSFLCLLCLSFSMVAFTGCGDKTEPQIIETDIPDEQALEDYDNDMEAP